MVSKLSRTSSTVIMWENMLSSLCMRRIHWLTTPFTTRYWLYENRQNGTNILLLCGRKCPEICFFLKCFFHNDTISIRGSRLSCWYLCPTSITLNSLIESLQCSWEDLFHGWKSVSHEQQSEKHICKSPLPWEEKMFLVRANLQPTHIL